MAKNATAVDGVDFKLPAKKQTKSKSVSSAKTSVEKQDLPVPAKKDIKESAKEPNLDASVGKEKAFDKDVLNTASKIALTETDQKAVAVEETKPAQTKLPVEESMTKKAVDRGVQSSKMVDKIAGVVADKQQAQHKIAKQIADNSTYGKGKPQHKSPYSSHKDREELPAVGMFPDHFIQLARIVKNNAEIRRFTSLGILNYLLQKGEIRGKSRYVAFKWNKFTVKADHLTKEYSYVEPFFINCLIAAFATFATSAQRTIDTFTRIELDKGIHETYSQEEVDRIVTATDKGE